ncbi:uncharacterized protein LOC142235683 [Haematobia irritans]|uniref:uncharacterized protein LOC142235683 n=1 Tax=Haematobia irritans TaxID=7368 RepID=UPI003F5098B0
MEDLQDKSLKDILKSLRGEDFYHIFKEYGVTEEALKIITRTQLDEIIPKNMYGAQVLFENRLKVWQQSVYHAEKVIENCPPEPMIIDVNKVCISDILRSSSNGRNVIAFYEKQKMLSPYFRKILSNCLTEYFIENNIVPTPTLFRRISYKIHIAFPTESEDIYYIHKQGRKPGGILYSKYHNTLSKLRKFGICEKPATIETEENVHEECEITDQELSNHKHWLKYNVEPYHIILEKWDATFTLRRNFLRGNHTLDVIYNEWPLYKKAFGYKLIDSDFNKLFPNKEDIFISKWHNFASGILKLFELQLKDKESLEILEKLKQSGYDDGKRNNTICHLLHYLVKPSSRKSYFSANGL